MTTTTATSTKTPAYVTLATAIAEDLRAAGIQLVPQKHTEHGCSGNKGWVCFQRADNLQKIYVKRTDRDGIIHTTLAVDPSTPGYVAPKENGKIASHFAADIALVRAHLLPLFVGTAERLRDAKAPVRRATLSNLDPSLPPDAELVKHIKAMGDSEVALWTTEPHDEADDARNASEDQGEPMFRGQLPVHVE